VFAIEGSADLKFQIKGQVDGIGTQPRVRTRGVDGMPLVEWHFETHEVADVAAALHVAGAWLREQFDIDPVAVGHRVVHGGPKHDRPVLVDAGVLAELEQYVCLAPLHQPNNSRRSARFPNAFPRCRRSPASIRHSIAGTAPSPIIMRSRSGSTPKACAAKASMGSRTNTSPSAFLMWRLRSPRSV
jgi:acetate kinase